MKMCKATNGYIVQELPVPSGDALDAPGELRQSVGRTKYHIEFVQLRSDTGDEIGTFASDVAIGLCGWPRGQLFW